MKAKIITDVDCDTCNQVLIHLLLDDDGNHKVNIEAWHTDASQDFYQVETLSFPSQMLAMRFIDDFSDLSATEFANSFDF